MTQPTNDGLNSPVPDPALRNAQDDGTLRDQDRLDRDRRDGDLDRDRRVGDLDRDRRDGDRDGVRRDDAGQPHQGPDPDTEYDVVEDPNVISLEEQNATGSGNGGERSRQRQAEERLAEGYDTDRDGHDRRDGDLDRDLDRDRRDDGLGRDGDLDRRDGVDDGSRAGAHRADVPVVEGDGPRHEGDVRRDDDLRSGDGVHTDGALPRDPEVAAEDHLSDPADLRRQERRGDPLR